MISQLAADIRNKKVILFAGAGLSNGLGLPTWKQLVDHIAQRLGYDPAVFSALSGSALSLAEYYLLEQGGIGDLRSWMDRNWHLPDEVVRGSVIHGLIARLGFPLIYTTNYDRLIERSLELHGVKVKKVVNVGDMVDAPGEATTVVKFHGDFDSDESMVLGESHYFERLAFQSPLDIKLRADALGKSLLFVGYSLSDINIRLMLHHLSRAWADSGQSRHRPKSYIFLPRPNSVQQRIFDSWGVTPIVGDAATDTEALEEFLRKLAEADA